MNNPAKKPTPRDREYLQAELTRMVGIGRIGLDTFQQLVDTVLETEDTAVLAQIHARYIGPPPAEWAPPAPPAPPTPQPPPHVPPQPMPGPQGHPPQQYPGQPPYPVQSYGPAPMAGGASQMYPAPPSPQNGQHFSSTMGTIKRAGQWLVPEYTSFKLNGATLDLDLREATAAGPEVRFDISATAATIKIVVPPGVRVSNQMKETWSESKMKVSAPAPGSPGVVLTGHARGSTIEVVTRAVGEKTFWEKFFE